MRTLRITIAQLNTTVGDLDGNVDRCIDALREAEAAGSDLVVFPELALTGYPPEDLLLKPGFLRECAAARDRFAAATRATCAVVGFVDGDGPVYNAAAVCHDGAVRAVYHKMHLPNYGVFDEMRYFTPGRQPLSFTIGDVCVGVSICEDTWIEDGPHVKLCAGNGADVVVNLSASPYHAGKLLERAGMLIDRAGSCDAAFVYANLVGGQDELVFDGGSMAIDRTGRVVAACPSFTEGVYTFDMTFEGDECRRRKNGVVIAIRSGEKPTVEPPRAPAPAHDDEILDALVVGTRDYLTKNGFPTAVIGLSGGIDSALVAAVAALALGPDNVVGVTMPSKYTSTGTRSDAEQLARNLGIRFMEIPIGSAFDAFTSSLAPTFVGREPDVTEENIQARVRGTLLMALSNKFGWLVLTTGNKSEVATGYCTLYGDMAGGFAVIKDVPKTTVFRLSRLVNERAGREMIPDTIITRPPSAELRPDQQDSDSLPPYEVLDPILEAYIERDMGVDAITALGYDREMVRRVVRLCDLSEYKRRQAPPGVKITHRAFGRDRRLPITNRFRP